MTNQARPSPVWTRSPGACGTSSTPSAVAGPLPALGSGAAAWLGSSKTAPPASGGVTTPTDDAGSGATSPGPSAGWGSRGSSRNSFWMRAAVSGFPWDRLRSSAMWLPLEEVREQRREDVVPSGKVDRGYGEDKHHDHRGGDDRLAIWPRDAIHLPPHIAQELH